jgi:rhamnogalacturonan endolyase
VCPVKNGLEQAPSNSFTYVAGRTYLSIPLQSPPIVAMPDGNTYTYRPNDCSVGDLDGDGEYEIVVKWDPSNSKDNSQSGYTGDVWLDAYKLDGTRLWRIDLGRNIRAGAHYTQFMVYDLDSDGRAEVACKTADGTVDGVGNVIGDAAADYRNASGYVLAGPEYLTIFDGLTGAALATTDYIPPRAPDTLTPSSSELNAIWGDGYGNRCDRFLACVAYLDGVHPSLVMCRGYYTRTTLTAWNWRGGQLTQLWAFDTYGHPESSS